MSGECQVKVKSQSELDIGGRETCLSVLGIVVSYIGIIGAIAAFVLGSQFASGEKYYHIGDGEIMTNFEAMIIYYHVGDGEISENLNIDGEYMTNLEAMIIYVGDGAIMTNLEAMMIIGGCPVHPHDPISHHVDLPQVQD